MYARIVFLAAALTAMAAAGAQPNSAGTLHLSNASFMNIEELLKSARGHPNEEWRWRGLQSYQTGRYDEAIARFQRAAAYADKFSQHYLSLIHWYGQGTAKDPVQAYIWSDLAAERGSYRLLLIREKMWSLLTPEQQQQVQAHGDEYYARYGDQIAKPKAETEIRRFTRNMTGSHIGYANQMLDVKRGGPIHGTFGNATPGMWSASEMVVGTVRGEEVYGQVPTDLTSYWREQDQALDSGDVEVGPLKPVQ